MNAISYINALEYRRNTLKNTIKHELKLSSRDEMKINALKKYRLRLKDKITSMNQYSSEKTYN